MIVSTDFIISAPLIKPSESCALRAAYFLILCREAEVMDLAGGPAADTLTTQAAGSETVREEARERWSI